MRTSWWTPDRRDLTKDCAIVRAVRDPTREVSPMCKTAMPMRALLDAVTELVV